MPPWLYSCRLRNEISHVRVIWDSYIGLIFNNYSMLDDYFSFQCWQTPLHDVRQVITPTIQNRVDVAVGILLREMWCLANVQGSSPIMKFDYYEQTYECNTVDHRQKLPKNGIVAGVRSRNSKFNRNIGDRMLRTTIPLNEFICDAPNRCPPGCECVFRSANVTLHMYCSAANLASLPLDLPPIRNSYVKYKLDFSNNKRLCHLEHRPYFVNTSILDVSNCRLTEITVEVLKEVSPFSVVNIRGNMLQSFPREATTVSISTKLLIGYNPWKLSLIHI